MRWQQVFSPSSGRTTDWKLPTMISLAVFIHGMAFYLIQAAAPAPTNKPIRASRLSILDENRATDLPLLRWIENHDPASIMAESPAPPAKFLRVPYQPSYETNLPEPLPPSLETSHANSLTFFPPGRVPEIQSGVGKTEAHTFNFRTRVAASDSIKLTNSPGIAPPKIGDKLPSPTQFFVVGSSVSEERFYFLTQSSGDEKLDSYARNWLAKSRISFAEGKTSGWITLHWGNEIWTASPP